jgi:hypothetical protein
VLSLSPAGGQTYAGEGCGLFTKNLFAFPGGKERFGSDWTRLELFEDFSPRRLQKNGGDVTRIMKNRGGKNEKK